MLLSAAANILWHVLCIQFLNCSKERSVKPVQNNKYLKFCAEHCSETLDTKGVPIFHVWDGEPKIFQNPRGNQSLANCSKIASRNSPFIVFNQVSELFIASWKLYVCRNLCFWCALVTRLSILRHDYFFVIFINYLLWISWMPWTLK